MEKPSTISRIQLNLATALLVGSIALTSVGLSSAANAAPRGFGGSYGQGTYHEDVLPNGALTGPIAPDANGG